jgi:uncharacterized protein (DUF433 family)
MKITPNTIAKEKEADPRLLPIYTVREAAHYLHVPAETLRAWISGRDYPTKSGKRFSPPIIEPPQPFFDQEDKKVLAISFINLVEAHVLSSIRTIHGLHLHKARDAARYLRDQFGTSHPLAEFDLDTDGANLFLRQFGKLLNISHGGQLALKEVVEIFLKRIDRDSEGSPLRFYPFTRRDYLTATELKLVVIDPQVSWGRAVLRDTGIPTSMIVQRFWAGDSISHLANDYDRQIVEIEEAIRCELEAIQ